MADAHPLTDAYPMMMDGAFTALKDSIGRHGLCSPIVVLDGKILDGRNRLKACAELGIKPDLTEYEGDRSPGALADYVRITNERRDLTGEQRAAALLLQDEWLAEQRAEAKQRQLAHDKRDKTGRFTPVSQKIDPPAKDKNANRTTQKIAHQAGTNRQYVADLAKLKTEEPELFESVRTGEKKLVQAKRVVKEKKREAKRQANRAKVEEVSDPLQAVGEVQYSAIVIDPP